MQRWSLAAVAIYAIALTVPFGSVWRDGPRQVVPATSPDGETYTKIMKTDTTYVSWLVARNAYTLARRPHRVFETEHCHPTANALTMSEPMLSMGLLGVPVDLATRDPILTYNIVLLLLPLIGALGMFALVADWTRIPAAGVVAGLLYAFHPIQLADISHPFQRELGWTIWALFFARRLFANGRWRDAVGLTVCGALQLGNSFYPVLATTFLAPAVIAWLVITYGIGRLRWSTVAMALVGVALAAAFVFGPYLEIRDATGTMERTSHFYKGWRDWLPGAKHFPGWGLLALVVAGVAFPRRRALDESIGDPRPALLVGGFLVLWISAGPRAPLYLPDLHALLKGVVPGLSSVRAIGSVNAGVHAVLCVIAGIGAAGLLRWVPQRARTAVSAGAIAAVAVLILQPGWLGFAPPVRYASLDVRPPPTTVTFFEELERRGNRGPILEVPTFASVDRGPMQLASLAHSPGRVALTIYHHRKTSACLGSYSPPKRLEVGRAADRLPEPGAIREIAEFGFTTLVVRRTGKPTAPPKLRKALRQESKRAGGTLRLVHATSELEAYEITP